MHTEQVQRVVHADADADSDHRQSGHFQADPQPDHQRLADNGGHQQRNQCHQGRAPAAEGQEAEQRRSAIHRQVHGDDALLYFDVGRRLDAGVARCQQELHRLLGIRGRAVVLGKVFGDFQHPAQRIGLVVGQVGNDRRHRALLVGDPRSGNHRCVHRRVGDGLVTADAQPFRAAFGHAGADHAHGFGQRLGRLNTWSLTQTPGQFVHALQGLVQAAAVFVGLHDDHELVTGEPIVGGDIGVVTVVA
ncbi:hypothetical protein D3C80_1004070 [compost metagenome]